MEMKSEAVIMNRMDLKRPQRTISHGQHFENHWPKNVNIKVVLKSSTERMLGLLARIYYAGIIPPFLILCNLNGGVWAGGNTCSSLPVFPGHIKVDQLEVPLKVKLLDLNVHHREA